MRHQRLNTEGLNTEGKTLESRRNDEHTTGVGPAASRCLSEDEVMRLCAGEISEEHLGRIDEHLDRCEECQRWVAEVMAHGSTNQAGDDASTYPTAFRAGTMAAGRFRIVRFIKRGGMGEVYEAFDSVLETRVALKTIISTACDSPRAVRKLKAEVQLARSIRHPNVCSVFDIWAHHPVENDDTTVYFFTMEFIDGLSMRQALERSLFDLGETLRIARLELLGLRAAHDTGVVHRDFKSDNVMLRSDRHGDSQIVVMDFGLARTLQKEEGASADSEQFAGSVAYMAPEQVEGKRHIGPEADVFAFGVVLFEMLTGELPWVGDSPWTTAALRLTQRAPAPSRHRPGLSPRLDAFVLKCLAREPTDRFRDGREALIAFDELLLGPPPRRSRSWMAVAATALALAAVVVALQQRTASRIEALQPAGREERAAASTPNPTAPTPGVPSAPLAAVPAATEVVAAVANTTTDPAALTAAPPIAPIVPGESAPAPSGAPQAPESPGDTRSAPDPAGDDPERTASSARSSKSRSARAEAFEADGPPEAMPSADASAAMRASAAREATAESDRIDVAQTVSDAPSRRGRAPGAPAKLRGFE